MENGVLKLHKDLQIRRLWKILILLLLLALTVAILALCLGIHRYRIGNEKSSQLAVPYISCSMSEICLYAFGLLMVSRYSATRLRIFAWVQITRASMLSIGVGIFILILILSAILYPPLKTESLITIYISTLLSDLSTFTMIIFITLPIIDFVLTTLLIGFCLKLARLIDEKKKCLIYH